MEVTFESKPAQASTPWGIQYTWAPPTKTVWPQALSYTYTATGKQYYTLTLTRATAVLSGSLVGSLLVSRGPGDETGGSDKPLTATTPLMEIWQANGKEGTLAKVGAAPCAWEAGTPTFTFNTPGASTRCTYTFLGGAGLTYDPEQDAELRVATIGFTGTNVLPAVTNTPPYALENYGPQTGTPNRCAAVTDTLTLPSAPDKPSPYTVGNVVLEARDGSAAKPPPSSSTPLTVCATTVFRYSATFPSVAACSTTAFAVGVAPGERGWGSRMGKLGGGGNGRAAAADERTGSRRDTPCASPHHFTSPLHSTSFFLTATFANQLAPKCF